MQRPTNAQLSVEMAMEALTKLESVPSRVSCAMEGRMVAFALQGMRFAIGEMYHDAVAALRVQTIPCGPLTHGSRKLQGPLCSKQSKFCGDAVSSFTQNQICRKTSHKLERKIERNRRETNLAVASQPR
jgi:hypothetical protein